MDDAWLQGWQAPALAGAIALAFAIFAGWAERRRLRRKHADAVGCMPWTLLYIVTFLIAIVLLGHALRAWFAA